MDLLVNVTTWTLLTFTDLAFDANLDNMKSVCCSRFGLLLKQLFGKNYQKLAGCQDSAPTLM